MCIRDRCNLESYAQFVGDDVAQREMCIRDSFLAVNIVEGAADGHRNNRYDEDVDEHSHSIYMDNLACRRCV